MKKAFSALIAAGLALCSYSPPASAVDVNFNLLNVNNNDQSRLEQVYSKAYGFTPQQIAPVMSAPAMEVPSILQIAQNAATMPLAIWGMRKMGLSYMDILKVYTLPPTTLFNPEVPYDRFGAPVQQAWGYQQQYGNQWPSTISIADNVISQLGQLYLLTHYLKMPATQILALPTEPLSFTRLILEPYHSPTYFLPPGQAKKMGLWLPPGQAKKLGLWEPPGQAKKHWKHGDWDDDDHDHHGHGHDKWKWEAKEHEHGHGHGRWKD